VRVRVPSIPVDVEVGDHSARYEFALHELPRQPDRFGLAQLLGQGELDLAGDLRVASFLTGLDRVPQ
jgi:hypothetical protein